MHRLAYRHLDRWREVDPEPCRYLCHQREQKCKQITEMQTARMRHMGEMGSSHMGETGECGRTNLFIDSELCGYRLPRVPARQEERVWTIWEGGDGSVTNSNFKLGEMGV